MAGQVIAWDQIFCNSIMNSVHHDTINALSALPHSKDDKDLLLLSGAMLLYPILMHVKVVLSNSNMAVERFHQKLSEVSFWPHLPKKCQDIQKLHEHISSHLKSINNVLPPLMMASMLKAYRQINARPNCSSYVTTLQNNKMTGTNRTHSELIQMAGEMYANLKEHKLTSTSANTAQADATKAATPKKSGAPKLDLKSDANSKAMLMKTITKNTVYKNDGKETDGAEAMTKTDKKPHIPAPACKFEKKEDTIEKKVGSAMRNKYVWCPHHKKDGVLHGMYCKMPHDCNVKK
jgi:hypothetical protein